MENSEGLFDFDVEWDKQTWDHFQTLLKNYPISAKEAVAQYLNDQARTYKELVPRILGTRYTIRSKAWVNARVKVRNAKKNGEIEKNSAEAYTEDHPSNSPQFTGWEEEIEGAPREIRRTAAGNYRVVWSNARKGNNSNVMEGGAKMNPTFGIPNSEDAFGPGRIPQFIAALARNPSSMGMTRQRTFILKGGGFKYGLYRFKPGESDYGPTQPEIEMLQEFTDTPPRAPKWDWARETREKVNAYFPADYVWEHYLQPIVLQELRK